MMTTQRLAIAASAVSLALALAAPAVHAQETAADISRGAKVYGAMCGRCHTARSPLERGDREWITIANHMRVRGNLTGQQMRAVVAFLHATNTDPSQAVSVSGEARELGIAGMEFGGPVSSDQRLIEEGRQLLEQNACLGCHALGNAGGNVGPSLNRVVQRKGAPHVRQKIASPTYDNATSMMPNFGLTREQIEAITAYLATFGGSN